MTLNVPEPLEESADRLPRTKTSSESVEGSSASELEATVDALLRGAVDLHCHSGPSVMPRDIDHIEAIEEAAAAGFRAVLFKDHYYSVTPIVQLLTRRYKQYGVTLLSGVALNNSVGGLNRYAVDHAIKLGGKIVWMPTFSAANHIDHHRSDPNFDKKFPTTLQKMVEPTPLRVTDERGLLMDEVKCILDLIAAHDVVLSAGHLNIKEIWTLFEEAKARGVKRLLVNHPNYIVDASPEDMRQLVSVGAYLEHSACMYVDGSKFHFYDTETLRKLIHAGGVDWTILGSDLGQSGNPHPVEGFRRVIEICLGLGFTQDEIRRMTSTNAAKLMGLSD
jgi:hypothetical protein